MATITKTIAETGADPSGAKSTWTVQVSANDIILNEEKTFYLPIPTVKAKYTAYGTKNSASVRSILYLDQSGMPPKWSFGYLPNYQLGGFGTVINMLAPNTYGNVDYVGDGETTTHTTSEYFNSSNPTQGAIPLNVMVASLELNSHNSDGYTTYNPSGYYVYNLIKSFDESLPPLAWGTVASIKLDVPPTYVASSLHIDTTAIYSDITTVSVDVSDLTAYYGGYITSAELKIGNQTATLTGDATNVLSSGTLSIPLDTAGTFTPTVTITDSRGQTATKTYATITVNSYVAPALSMNLERVDANGESDDEGAYGLITATISYTNAIVKLLEPTVTIDGVATATTNWYTDRALTTLVDWSDYNPASPVTIYGYFGGSFSTQSSYLIGVTPIDTHTSGTEVTQTLATAFYTIDFRAGGHGIAFGQPSSQDGFECNMPTIFHDTVLMQDDVSVMDGNNVLRALFDFMHPVGSYYETSDASFDPNVTWGGTWVSETETYIEDIKTVRVGASIAMARGSRVSITAPTESGYTFVSWGAVSTVGWIGSIYAEVATSATTNCWVSYSGGSTSGNGTIYVSALYKKVVTKTRWHRTA